MDPFELPATALSQEGESQYWGAEDEDEDAALDPQPVVLPPLNAHLLPEVNEDSLPELEQPTQVPALHEEMPPLDDGQPARPTPPSAAGRPREVISLDDSGDEDEGKEQDPPVSPEASALLTRTLVSPPTSSASPDGSTAPFFSLYRLRETTFPADTTVLIKGMAMGVVRSTVNEETSTLRVVVQVDDGTEVLLVSLALRLDMVGADTPKEAVPAMERRLKHLEGMMTLRVEGRVEVQNTIPVLLSIHLPGAVDLKAMEKERSERHKRRPMLTQSASPAR